MQKSKSQISTNVQSPNNLRLLQCIQELQKQNDYLKKAIHTAENLINNYQKQNKMLTEKIKILNRKFNTQSDAKCFDVESVMKNNSLIFNSTSASTLTQNQSRQLSQQILQLNLKIKKFIHNQQQYQSKINQMQNKIKNFQQNDKSSRIYETLNIKVPSQIYYLQSSQHSKELKPKSLSQLRHLHTKSKSIHQDGKVSSKYGKLGIVQRMFSKQLLYEYDSVGSNRKSRHSSTFSSKKK